MQKVVTLRVRLAWRSSLRPLVLHFLFGGALCASVLLMQPLLIVLRRKTIMSDSKTRSPQTLLIRGPPSSKRTVSLLCRDIPRSHHEFATMALRALLQFRFNAHSQQSRGDDSMYRYHILSLAVVATLVSMCATSIWAGDGKKEKEQQILR